MKRINLATLKKALDKIPIEHLENYYIMHPYSAETDNEGLEVIVWTEDWTADCDKFRKEINVIDKFAKAVFEDAKIILQVGAGLKDAEDFVDDIQ